MRPPRCPARKRREGPVVTGEIRTELHLEHRTGGGRRITKETWLRIRGAYIVQGWSAVECGKTFGVHPTTIKTRAAREGWTTQRDQIATDATGDAARKIAEVLSEQLASHLEVIQMNLRLVTTVAEKFEALIMAAGEPTLADVERWIDSGKALGIWSRDAMFADRVIQGKVPGDRSDDVSAATTPSVAKSIGIFSTRRLVPEIAGAPEAAGNRWAHAAATADDVDDANESGSGARRECDGNVIIVRRLEPIPISVDGSGRAVPPRQSQ